jgi:hypothetical protein
MRAAYDLSRYPANFNFVEFLVAARTLGADHIVFDDTKGYKAKFSRDDTARRMESILLPACALAGVGFSFGPSKRGDLDPGYHMKAPVAAYTAKGELKKLKSIQPPESHRYTVTIRNSERYKERNSDQDAWRRFAREIGALVIEDFGDKTIHLHKRMALYSGAEMNFMVANGPGTLLWFSDNPYMVFMKNVNAEYHNASGHPVGKQVPWAHSNQKFVWGPDDYESIKGAISASAIGS